MNLHRILKEIKYQDKFDCYESQEYKQFEKKDGKIAKFLRIVLVTTIFGTVFLIPFFNFFFLPLGSAIALCFMGGLFVKKFKLKKKELDDNFSASLFQYLSAPDHLAVLFKALGHCAYLKNKHNLVDSFFKVKSLLAETASCDIKNKKQIEDKIISGLEPLFHDFLKHQKDNEQFSQHQFESDQKNRSYQAAIEDVDDSDDMMFSTYPPLKVNARAADPSL